MRKLTSRDEDYLETIYRISQDHDTVGVTDIARARNVAVPTARTAVAKLVKYGLVRQQHYGKIILNPTGIAQAKQIYGVHQMLLKFLAKALMVSPDQAEIEACRMEHGLSKNTLKRLARFLEAIQNCSNGSPACIVEYRESIKRV